MREHILRLLDTVKLSILALETTIKTTATTKYYEKTAKIRDAHQT